MLKEKTRLRLIQVWFAAVAVVVATGVTFGVSVTIGTGILLAALSIVPPAIIFVLWPAVQPPTVAEILHDAERS